MKKNDRYSPEESLVSNNLSITDTVMEHWSCLVDGSCGVSSLMQGVSAMQAREDHLLNLPSPIPEEPASLGASAGNATAPRRAADSSPANMPEPRLFTPRPYSPAAPIARSRSVSR